jgi:hypothetical protein
LILFFEICGKEEEDDDEDDGFISEMLCVLWFCLFHNCSSFVLFWRPKHSKHSQKKKKRKKKNTTELLGWVKSFVACLLCTRFSVNWTEKDSRRSEQQLLHSSPGDLCNPSKQSPPKKTQETKKKRNNKNCKNLTSSSLSLSPPKANTKTPTNSPKQKAITKTSKTHTTSSKTPPPTTKISSKRMYVQNFLNTLLHLPFATITHQNSQTHQNQSIDLHSKKEEEEEEEGNKTQQNTQRVERQKREERERERGFD